MSRISKQVKRKVKKFVLHKAFARVGLTIAAGKAELAFPPAVGSRHYGKLLPSEPETQLRCNANRRETQAVYLN